MRGGSNLLWIVLMFALLAASLWAENDAENVAGNSADDPAAGPAKPPSAPSAARVAPVGESWHGHTVVDNYRGLEDSANPDTRTWVEGQLAYTRSLLDPLPGRQQMEQRLTELLAVGTISAPQPAGSYYFYTRRDGHQNQPILYVRAGLHGDDRVLLDPNTLAADGTVALDWWYPSEDGKHVAYGISPGGSEISTLHVIETATGKLLPDAIDRARAASVAWKKDDSGFYYTRLPRKGEVAEGQELYNRHVFYHALGTDPAHDPLILGEGRNPQDWPNVSLSEDGRWLLITVQVTYTKTELFLQDTSTTAPLLRITPGLESIYHGEVFHGDLYITSNEGAPRYRVFRASTAHPEREHWQEIIPQSDAVLNGAGVIGGKLFSQYEKDASSRLRVHSLEGKLLEEIPLPGIGTVFGTGGRHDRDEAFFAFHSYTVPPSVYRYDLKIKQTETWAQVKAPIDPAAYEVKQLWYTSKDGTRVPMFVVHKKGLVLNGKNPTLLTGYGGFNVSSTPNFNGTRYVWLEHGGVYAVANLRGGSEFGEDWHQAGMLEKKQNVFDDFFAAGEFLIAQGYTDKAHLAAQGGSNGGLLMGVAVTQRPDLWRAVVCQVPLLDMLRYQNFQIARLWIPEYGSAENPKQFDYLYAYSPYHHVKAGTEYPAILFMTADTDTRVDPMHAKKMAALMQAEAKNGQSKDRPILLRIEPKAGHGAGKPVHKVIEEGVDIYSFLFWQLGVRP